MINLPWQRFEKKSTTIEKHAGMVEQLVRALAIEEALQIAIKYTLSGNKSIICAMVC